MSLSSITASTRTAAAAGGSLDDFAKLSSEPKKFASGNAALGKPRSPSDARRALGPESVALKPDEVKALATAFLPIAQKIVDTTFAPFITAAPPLQLKLWSPEQMKANNPGQNMDGTVAYTDTGRPGIVNVAYASPMFKNLNVDAKDLKMYLVHEVLHTRSAAFSVDIQETYGKPLANGKPATFSDGSEVRGITEGLTEIYTLMATSQKKSSATYGREMKWAYKLGAKVGPDTLAKAYFGNDAASMALVKKAIDELVAEDKRSPASARSR